MFSRFEPGAPAMSPQLPCVTCVDTAHKPQAAMYAATMKRSISLAFCCACYGVRQSASFITTKATISQARSPTPFCLDLVEKRSKAKADTEILQHHRRLDRTSTSRRRPARRSTTPLMAAAEERQEWLTNIVSCVAAVSMLVGAVAVGPLDAGAQAKAVDNRPESVVQALVQLPDELDDWTKLVPDYDQAPGANIVITASRQGSDKPVLGATIAMEKLRFPVMMQLFPVNAVGGAKWPGDFEEKDTYAVQVRVCGGGETRSAACEAPPLVGSGQSIFVSGLEGIPEVAESGGMRVPATVVLARPR